MVPRGNKNSFLKIIVNIMMNWLVFMYGMVFYPIMSQISKSNVVDDMVESNRVLYEKGEKPDHCVVIKYVPYVGDSKRAMDEYTSEIFMHGLNTIVLHNTCEVCILGLIPI